MVSTRNKNYGNSLPLKRMKRKKKPRPCTEFTLFPRLPCELRLMIWQASMTPRLVAVGPKGLGSPRSQHSRKILPALLSVNRDSRYCALRHYTLKFTITLTVDKTGLHRWDCPEFQGTNHHANVVMSPDDTLGLFGWDHLDFGHGTRFRVKDANGKDPWKSFPSSHGAQPEVKKLAYLGEDMAWQPWSVCYLNSGAMGDLDSILHTKRTDVRKLAHPRHNGRWTKLVAPYIKSEILIQSRNFNGTLQDWGERLIYRAKRGALARWHGAPDIFAFELGKKPEKIYFPAVFVPAESIQDLYRVLPHSFVLNILDDFYRSREWKWSVRYPDRRGF